MRKRAKLPVVCEGNLSFHGDVWFERVRPTRANGIQSKRWFRAGAFHGDDYAEVEGPTREACMVALAPFFEAIGAA